MLKFRLKKKLLNFNLPKHSLTISKYLLEQLHSPASLASIPEKFLFKVSSHDVQSFLEGPTHVSQVDSQAIQV
jgi:hypothetical protein